MGEEITNFVGSGDTAKGDLAVPRARGCGKNPSAIPKRDRDKRQVGYDGESMRGEWKGGSCKEQVGGKGNVNGSKTAKGGKASVEGGLRHSAAGIREQLVWGGGSGVKGRFGGKRQEAPKGILNQEGGGGEVCGPGKTPPVGKQ